VHISQKIIVLNPKAVQAFSIIEGAAVRAVAIALSPNK
jgi:hypothetical protein